MQLPNSNLISATDVIGGEHIPKVKLVLGAEGSNDGNLSSSNAMPVYQPGVALDSSISSLITAVNNLKAVVDSLNAKTTTVNTGAVTVTNPTPVGLTDVELRSTPVATTNTGLENTSTELANLTSAIKEMSDTQLYVLSAILDKLPRLDRNDRVNAMVSDASGNELNSSYYGISSNFVGESTGGRQYSRIFEPWQLADAGSARLYQQIQVT